MESGRGGPAEGLAGLHRFCERLAQNVERVIIGKREVIDLVTVALLVEGHILFEDVPGTGKTMLARAFATSLGGSFKRIQFTPDLLPNDVTGVSVFNQKTQEFEFRPGPAFSNLLLADEVNRATPRTQSALLESMGEGQVTVGRRVPPPAPPLPGHGHPEPDRVRGHLPPPGGPAGPLHAAPAPGLRRPGGRAAHPGRPARRAPHREPAAGGADRRSCWPTSSGCGRSTSRAACGTTSWPWCGPPASTRT